MINVKRLLKRAKEYYKVRTINLYSYLNLASIIINTADKRDYVKRMVLEKTVAIMRRAQMIENSLEIVQRRYKKLSEVYEFLNLQFRSVKAKLLYRGLVGTGEGFSRLAFEIGLSWDPILQLPFFPSSSIKGAARVIADAVSRGEENMNVKIEKNDVDRIFGYSKDGEARMGTVVFHDAYPIEPNEGGLILEPDVITPIYKDQIEEHRVSPTPIPFLAIARGVTFLFPLASKYEDDLNKAEECLKRALEYGVGAKTLIGYSVFKVVEEC